MNFKTTFTLLALAAMTVVVLVPGALPIVMPGAAPAGTATQGATWPILTKEFKPANIRSIEVVRGGRPLVQLTGTPKPEANEPVTVWSLPGNWPIREPEVQDLVKLLTDWKERFAPIPVDKPEDLKAYGLDKPEAVVTVRTADKEYRLSFGEPPGDNNRFSRPTYLRVAEIKDGKAEEQPEVVRLAPGIIGTLDHPADYYQQRRLFRSEPVAREGAGPASDRTEQVAATALEGKGPDSAFALTKRPDGSMVLHEDWGDDLADPEKLKAVLTAVPDLWADFFVADPKKDLVEYGLATPERTLRVTGTDGKTIGLLIGKESPREEKRSVPRQAPPGLPPGVQLPPEIVVDKPFRYAKLENNDRVFEIRGTKLGDIFVKASDLRDATLARFKPDEVRRLELTRGDFNLVAVKGVDDKWKLEKPLTCAAEPAKITELLAQLAGLQATGADVITTKDWKAYDLEKPAATIVLTIEEKVKGDDTAKKERTVTFDLGKDDAEKKKLYVRVAGWDRINAVDDALQALVSRPALAYRGRNLLDFPARDVAQLDVKRGAETFTLKKEKDAWRLTEPVAATVDAAKVDRLANDLGRLTVVEYVTEEPKEEDLDALYGLAKPALLVTATFADAQKPVQTLRVGKPRGPAGEYFAKLESAPQVFVIRKEDHDTLDQPSLAYRPVQLWQVPTSDLTTVKIQRGAEPAYQLTRTGKDWKVSEPFEAPVAANLAKILVDPLGLVRCQRYEAHAAKELAAYGLDKPALQLTVTADEKKGEAPPAAQEHTLLIGKPTAEGAPTRFAKLADDEAVVVIDDKLFQAADRSVLDLLDRNLLKVDPKTVTRLESTGGEEAWGVERKDNAWLVAVGESKFAPDAATLDATLAAWANLRAARFAAYGPKVDWAEYGLDKPASTIKITVEGADAKREHTLAIGKVVAADSGDRYARLDDGPGVIVLPAAVVGELTRTHLDFVDHSVLELDPASIVAIRRAVDKKELEVVRRDGSWRLTKPNDYPADEPTLEGLAQTLGRLRGVRVAAYPAKDLKPFGLDTPAATITLVLTDGEKVIKIGEVADKEAGDRFAMLDGGDKVIVLPGRLLQVLLGSPLQFRDRTVARLGDADRVTMDRNGRKATFARIDGTWKMVSPVETGAEQADLDEFVNAVARLRAAALVADRTEITPADLKTYGLDKPEVQWHFQAGDKEVLNLQVGAVDKATGRAYARLADGDVVFLLDPKTTRRVLAEYRTRALWPPLDAAQMERLVYVTPKGAFVLEKGNTGWQVSGKPDAVVNATAVNDTLAALANLKAERFVVDKDADLKLYGLATPELLIEGSSRTGKCQLQIGHVEGDSKRYYARVGEGNHTEVVVLSESDSNRIVRAPAAFTAPQPKEAP